MLSEFLFLRYIVQIIILWATHDIHGVESNSTSKWLYLSTIRKYIGRIVFYVFILSTISKCKQIPRFFWEWLRMRKQSIDTRQSFSSHVTWVRGWDIPWLTTLTQWIKCICFAQSENLRNLEIALRIVRIPRFRTIVAQSRAHVQKPSRGCERSY